MPPKAERTLAFTPNGLDTSYARVARACLLTYIMVVGHSNQFKQRYLNLWKEVVLLLKADSNVEKIVEGMSVRAHTKLDGIVDKLVLAHLQHKLVRAALATVIKWRNYQRFKQWRRSNKRIQLDDAYHRDVALESASHYAGQFKGLEDQVSKLNFVLTAKDQQIADLKQQARDAESEVARLKDASVSDIGRVEAHAAEELESANQEICKLREQCAQLQSIAREAKASAEMTKEQLLLVQIEHEHLIEEHRQLEMSSTAGAEAQPPTEPVADESTSPVLVSGGHEESRVGGRWTLPDVGVACARVHGRQQGSPQGNTVSRATPAKPAAYIDQEFRALRSRALDEKIKDLEGKKAQALKAKDYKQAHVLLKQLEQIAADPDAAEAALV